MSPGKESGPVANKNVPHMPVYQGHLNLNDPTSVRMQSSFLIKNQHSANFEQYLQMMKKRKVLMLNQTNANTFGRTQDSPLG